MKGQSWWKRREEKLIQKLQNLVDLCHLGSQDIQACCDRHVPAQWCAPNKLSSHRDTGMVARSCQSLPRLVVCLWAWPRATCEDRADTAWSSGELCQHPTVCTVHCLQTRWNFSFFPYITAFSRLLVHGNGISQTVSDQSSLLKGRHWWLRLALL